MSRFTKIIYTILFLTLLLQPHFAPHIGFVPKPFIESLVTVFILSLAALTYYLHRRLIRKQADRLKIYDEQVVYLKDQAFHDPLTGLPNRLLLKDRIVTSLSRAERYGEKVAILFMDIDKFKYINDTLGHKVGDLLLKEVGQRLKQHMRGADTVARLGGDEFVVVAGELQSKDAAEKLAESILQTLRQPYRFKETELSVSASIGISVYPEHGRHEDILLKLADDTLYKVKEQGGSNYLIYTN